MEPILGELQTHTRVATRQMLSNSGPSYHWNDFCPLSNDRDMIQNSENCYNTKNFQFSSLFLNSRALS